MVVSRFLKFPIQNEFVGKRFSHQRPLGRVFDPSGAGGYVRGAAAPPAADRGEVSGALGRRCRARPGGATGRCDPPHRAWKGPHGVCRASRPRTGQIGGCW